MKKKGMTIGMKPSHPGPFIKTEVLDELVVLAPPIPMC